MQTLEMKYLPDISVVKLDHVVLISSSASGEAIIFPLSRFATKRGTEIAYGHTSRVFARYNLDLKRTMDFEEYSYFVNSGIRSNRF